MTLRRDTSLRFADSCNIASIDFKEITNAICAIIKEQSVLTCWNQAPKMME